MRPLRLRSTLAYAFAAHAGVAGALLLVARPGSRAQAQPLPEDELFVVMDEAPPRATAKEVAVSTPTTDLGHADRPREARSRGAPVTPVETTEPDAPEHTTPPPVDSTGRTPSPRAPISLGIGDYWKTVATAAVSDAQRPFDLSLAPSTGRLPSADRLMKDDLDALDRNRGLGAGGPLVTAAHEAASLDVAPDTGSATFDVESDASGAVTRATLVNATAEEQKWRDVARALVSALASKRLHVPPGAHGVRARLRIAILRTLPSGEHLTAAPGAVPDDVPGGDKACDGEGIHRKCFERGMPLGASGTWGDLSNIGARRARIVHASVVSEERL